ncbi:hypothetical protein C2G38_2159544 [Gigaspora rosea]|uniref:CCHC-type domain-containing protein n=1 Tax=Gigaspora rosea TaxID=44941 RepID=A0A397W0T8_9GLOM|nr:hypothetical protein C2G38_2159544 [Gigaspora rosea]
MPSGMKKVLVARLEEAGSIVFGNEKPKVDIGVDNWDDFDTEGFVNLEGDDIDAESQEADDKVRDELAACFLGKRKVESVPVDIFLSTLGNLEMKSADNEGWSAALQIVGSNDKMMEKYKDRILSPGQVETMFCNSNWGYHSRSKYRQQKRKRYSSPSSDSERGEFYKKSKKRSKRSYSFRGKESFNFAELRGAITCFNCGGVRHIASGCSSSGSKAASKSRNEDWLHSGVGFERGSKKCDAGESIISSRQNANIRGIKLLAAKDRSGSSCCGLVNEWSAAIPTGALVIATQPVPRQYTLSEDQEEWVSYKKN